MKIVNTGLNICFLWHDLFYHLTKSKIVLLWNQFLHCPMDWPDVALLDVATIFLNLGSLFYQTIKLYSLNHAVRSDKPIQNIWRIVAWATELACIPRISIIEPKNFSHERCTIAWFKSIHVKNIINIDVEVYWCWCAIYPCWNMLKWFRVYTQDFNICHSPWTLKVFQSA